jgi:hypothetical protein
VILLQKKLILTGALATALVFGGATYYTLNSGNVFAQATLQEENVTQDNSFKEDIQTKMLNSIDYFDRVAGNFVYHSDSAGYEYQVNYDIQTKKNNYASYVKMVSDNDNREVSYDGKNDLKNLINQYKLAREINVEQSKDESAYYKNDKPKNRFGRAQDGKKLYNYRQDPAHMDMAALSLFPQDFALGFLEGDNWNITSANETLANRNVVVISGNLNDYYQEKHHAKTFKLWVDKDTGILVQMEEYNEDGKAVEYLRTESLTVQNRKGEIKSFNNKVMHASSVSETKNSPFSEKVHQIKIPKDYKMVKFK